MPDHYGKPNFMDQNRYSNSGVITRSLEPNSLFNLDPISPGFGGDFMSTGQLATPTLPFQTGASEAGGGFMQGLGNLFKTFGGTSSFSEAGGGPSFLQTAFGGKDLDSKEFIPGFAGGLAKFGGDVFGSFMKYKGMKQAQDALDFQKSSFKQNFAANRQAYNQRADDLNFARRARHRGKDTFSKVEKLA